MKAFAVRIGSFVNNPGEWGEKVVWWAAAAAPTREAFLKAGFKDFIKSHGNWEKQHEVDPNGVMQYEVSHHGFSEDPRGSTWHDNPYLWSVHDADTMEFVGHYIDKAKECGLLDISGMSHEELQALKKYH